VLGQLCWASCADTVVVVNRPLEDLTVVDLTRFIAGSYATSLLAALGARVLKVEAPEGDPYRQQGTAWAHGESVLFMSLNAGKRSVVLDFRVPAGRELLERLLGRADFFVENARPGTLVRHGLDWASLHERYPTLIVGSISGYGDVGPDATKGGFDLILQAASGLMSVTGSADAGPVKVGAPFLDVGSGIACALGLVAAHVQRLSTGEGQLVSTSLLEFALAGLGNLAAGYLASGQVPGLLGTHSPTLAPYGGFRTADGWIVMAGANSEELWQRACNAIGAERLLSDPRFSDNAKRVAHRDQLTAALEEVLGQAPSRQWLAVLEMAGVPAAEVQSLDDVLRGAQVAALGAVEHLAHARAGDYAVIAPPVRFGGAPASYGAAAPVLGADTADVLRELGLADDELARLARDGTIVVA
jgi:crotonobetainyl-CoA:carnitine CoA-transferase CaiB-like acyl-CoA transferase